ncbi:MAG: methyl-accepting chemotaxis protein [Bryobacteraceae bacterium]
MRILLRNKIYGLAAVAAVLPVIVLLLLTIQFRASVTRKASKELTALAFANVEQTAKDIYGLCETANGLLQRQVNQNLLIARRLVGQRGGVVVGGGQVTWQATNQATQQTAAISLPRMTIGGTPATPDRGAQGESPMVDEVTRVTGGVISVFQRMNEQGDMLRVASTVRTPSGGRAVGTYVPAIGPDGTPSPMVSAVLRGETFRGSTLVVDDWYVAAYEPLRDVGGKVIGLIAVGERISSAEALRRTILDTTVGRTGHIIVLGCKGIRRGRYIISKDGKRDGENIWEARNASGELVVQPHIQKALSLGNGEVFHASYFWKNPGETQERMKRAAFIYFEPWDWLINASAYDDEYFGAVNQVESSLTSLLWGVTGGGILSLGAAIIIAFVMGSRVSRPIELATKIAGQVARGDLQGAQAEFSVHRSHREASRWNRFDFPDESEDLMCSFEDMTKNLSGLIGQVQRSGIQVTTSATEITASAKQLEATVAEQAAATREVSATSSQISATSRDLMRTMSGASDAMGEAVEQAESGQSELSEMENAMRELVKATGSISSRLGVISDRASKISTVVTTINKISDQTALLSLNAAIEAEKAGEFGKGFSAVAREVSRLADQTAVATQDIDSVVKEMQSAVSSGVMEMDKFSEEVRRRVSEVNAIASALGRMIEKVQTLGPEFETAKDGMNSQTQAAQQINEAMKQLAETAESTKALLSEFQQATGQLTGAVQGLQGEVSRFRTAS